jgi:hypothetical protein
MEQMGVEPTTPALRTLCSTKLSYCPLSSGILPQKTIFGQEFRDKYIIILNRGSGYFYLCHFKSFTAEAQRARRRTQRRKKGKFFFWEGDAAGFYAGSFEVDIDSLL